MNMLFAVTIADIPLDMKKDDYRDILQCEFEARRARNAFYSLRSFARDLELPPSSLSEVLNRKKGLSLKAAQRILGKLQLDEEEQKTFLLSVGANHSRSKSEKNSAQKKLKEHLSQLPSDSPKTFTIVGWVTEAVLKLSSRNREKLDPDTLATKLGVSKTLQFSTSINIKR